MSWVEIIKNDRLIYTGTCPKCGIMISQKDLPMYCPKGRKAPAASHVQNIDTCPMMGER